MKKIILLRIILIAYLFLPHTLKASSEDSVDVLVKFTMRYVLNTDSPKEKESSASFGETGNIPFSLDLKFDVSPFVLVNSGIRGLFFVYDSKFHQDRTSSELGIGYQKKNVRVFATYGIRLIRKKDESTTKALSLNFEKRETKSLGVFFKSSFVGIENDFEGKISYDGDDKWFYVSKMDFYFLSRDFPLHLSIFHESYLGSGTLLVFRNRKETIDVSTGYLFPEKRSVNKYQRTEGFLFGLTHTWR